MQSDLLTNNNDFFDYYPGRVLVCLGKKNNIAFDKYAPASMKAMNNAGMDVHFVVNECEGVDRKDGDVVRCRAIFLDDDEVKKDEPRTDFPLPPSLILETSPGKYHYHWLTDTTNIEEWHACTRGAIKTYNTDTTCANPAQLMRVPGYVNTKPHHNGWVVQLVEDNGKVYEWSEIVKVFPPAEAEPEKGIVSLDRPRFDYGAAYEDILAGKVIHESRRSLAMHLANTSFPKEEAVAMLSFLVKRDMDIGVVEHGRGQARLDNMHTSVFDAYRKVQSEQKADVVELFSDASESPYTKLSRPPGALALFADDVLEHMNHPQWEMALIAAMADVSVFGGGCYRARGKTVIRPRVVLAESTSGKNVFGTYFAELLRRLTVGTTHIHMDLFRGANAYTPLMIHKQLAQFRVRYYLITEAGISGKSKAGDQSSLRAYHLDFASTGYKKPVLSNQLQDGVNAKVNADLAPIYSCVPVQIFESTPGPYIDLLRMDNSVTTGEVNRREIIFVDPHKAYENEDEADITPDIFAAYKCMALNFLNRGDLVGNDPANPDKIEAVHIDEEVKARYKEASKTSIDEYNYRIDNGAMLENNLRGRDMERLWVTMLVQAIADAAYYAVDGEMSTPRITIEHFNWAVEYQQELQRSMKAQMEGGSMATPLELCAQRINVRRENFGDRAYDKLKPNNHRERHISRSWLTNALDRSKFKPMADLIDTVYRGDKDRATRAVVSECIARNILSEPFKVGKKEMWRLAE